MGGRGSFVNVSSGDFNFENSYLHVRDKKTILPGI